MAKPRGNKKTKSEIRDIQNKISDLISNATPYKTIMKELNLPQRTFYRYLDKVVADFKENYLSKSDRIVDGYIKRAEHRITEMHKQYEKTNDPKILKMAEDMERSKNQFKMDIGTLTKRAELINQEIKISYERPDWLRSSKKEAKK